MRDRSRASRRPPEAAAHPPRAATLRVLGLLGGLALAGCGGPAPPPRETLEVADLLGPAASVGFERAVGHRSFRFPEDHGPHEGFRTEWWYYTGNLETAEGRRFGYQLTFFKSALAPRPIERASSWGASQVFMAHFTITDVAGERFLSHERFARLALGLAGARGAPFRVWVEDWSAEAGAEGGMRLRAAEGEVVLDLALAPGKPPVLQGDAGLSRKGSAEGNASYYYSLTRMPTAGTLRLGERSFEVAGESWMDREWSTSVLEEGQVGWDWFALQLADGRELMLYQIRRQDDSADRHSAGTLIDASGDYRRLVMGDWTLETIDSWTSPGSGARYPAAWTLEVPADGLELEIRPLVADQELRHTFTYWEGAVEVAGTRGGESIGGRGYVELTGY